MATAEAEDDCRLRPKGGKCGAPLLELDGKFAQMKFNSGVAYLLISEETF
ncbi:hypothetical protein T4B_7421 [Trichinella pseudospiralis]|uniref:Uncharacterized protein n=1 Tax=Trichinella pseudospiralis TaxID=6337 RepID=A0A0V1J1S3_TRIPS|nr:hypothetical protein T4B_7421 [Trichinella pseudospiralis]KRZ28792.1 hypothetical protein T4C_102 [Trichinella pseudospiralis]